MNFQFEHDSGILFRYQGLKRQIGFSVSSNLSQSCGSLLLDVNRLHANHPVQSGKENASEHYTEDTSMDLDDSKQPHTCVTAVEGSASTTNIEEGTSTTVA